MRFRVNIFVFVDTTADYDCSVKFGFALVVMWICYACDSLLGYSALVWAIGISYNLLYYTKC